MTDNLPLIPSKRNGRVGDVRPVLRAVFRERAARLPPLPAVEPRDSPCATSNLNTRKRSEDEILIRETELRAQRARRLARISPPNMYTLHEPRGSHITQPPETQILLQRSDLLPGIDQNATRDTTLWVKNTLNKSSTDVSALEVRGAQLLRSPATPPPLSVCRSAQSLSLGEVFIQKPSPLPDKPPPTPPPEYIICIPTDLNFVNFTPGQLHTQCLRLVNMSQLEVHLSVRPPRRRELDVQLCGRLRVTSGAATELLVHFRPLTVCSLYDQMFVRVLGGRTLCVPISCYLQPPTLDIVIPNSTLSMLSCVLEGSYVSGERGGQREQEAMAGAGGEVLDLGARLLGDVHCTTLLLQCCFDHVSFFILTEDAWHSHDLSEVSITGAMVVGSFVISPAWWRGGGAVRGAAWCRPARAGLHVAHLRVLCDTAIARPLQLLADAIYFYPEYVTLQAHEKTYDICSEEDPDCEYYVHLGTTFPHLGLSASVLILNHSPVTFSYYWSVREWGKCSCWQEELAAREWLGPEDDPERLCPGAREARAASEVQAMMDTDDATGPSDADAARDPVDAGDVSGAGGASGTGGADDADPGNTAVAALRVEPALGSVAPRSSVSLQVAVPDVGEREGTQRAVLILVLRDIPQKSFPVGYYPMTVSSSTILTEHIPGLKREERVLCDVVCCQLEVWWHVAPLRFVLDPPLIHVPYSRRVSGVELVMRATHLFGGGGARAAWRSSRADTALPPAADLAVSQPKEAPLQLHFTELPNDFPVTETITLEEDRGRWVSQATVERRCATRHPMLRPHSTWLGVVAPNSAMKTHITIINDTYQDEDGCVATLVRVRRTEPDTAQVPHAAATAARSALIGYRVLAPRLTLTVSPCGGETHQCKIGCALDATEGAVLRPASALVAGLRTCYRLHLTNLTPISTRVTWQPSPDGESLLRVIFIPQQFDLEGYGEIEIRAVVEARRVCSRCVWVRRATVQHAHEPLYLLIDAAISGLEVDYWLPLPDYSLCLRRKQREKFPWHKPLPTTLQEAFKWEDEKRKAIFEGICKCKQEMRWLSPPPPASPPPPGVATPPVEVVSTPPPLTSVCACFACSRPLRPAPDPIAIEVREIPLKTVHTLRIRMRSVCVLAARWSACMRLGVHTQPRTLVTGDRWARLARACGAAARVSPARGVLGARAVQDLELRVYADSWGLYRDQLLILTEGLEPLVVNVWVRAVGCPLQFPLRPGASAEHYSENPPLLWVSEQDPEHTVHARNTSRAPLLLHAYLLRDHEHIQDAYPFRLCIRLFDVPTPVCPCLYTLEDSLSSLSGDVPSESIEEPDTGVEVYLAPDYGIQDSTYFKVEPHEQAVCAGGSAQWRVCAQTHAPPPHTLLLRIQPLEPHGPWWFRDEPAAAAVRLRSVRRAGLLELSHEQVLAHLCTLAVPVNETMRIRKRLCLKNVGDGLLLLFLRIVNDPDVTDVSSTDKVVSQLDKEEGEKRSDTDNASHVGNTSKSEVAAESVSVLPTAARPEWRLVRGERRGACGARCRGGPRAPRQQDLELAVPAHSTFEISVEVSVRCVDVWPAMWSRSVAGLEPEEGTERLEVEEEMDQPQYEADCTYTSHLQLWDEDSIIKSVPLVLQLESPHVVVRPAELDLGYVSDGDTRKTYFTVSHTSSTETISVSATWRGGLEFRVHPAHILLPPEAEHNVYIIYTARFTGAVAEGRVDVRAAGAAGAWCRAAVRVRACATRDYKCHLPPHDHTDDSTLLAPDIYLTTQLESRLSQ